MGGMVAARVRVLAIALALAFLGGCAQLRLPTHERNVALWASASAEYAAVALQIYATATEKLDVALLDPSWTALHEQTDGYESLPPAIIVDLDETILDNRPFQMRLIREGRDFDEEFWNEWVTNARVEAIPGSVEFLQYAQELGVEVFYITNRSTNVEQATRENLALLGLSLNPEIDTLLTKNERPEWTSDKQSRRRLVGRTHRVLLNIGDNLDDFTRVKGFSRDGRRKATFANAAMWGEKWFMIPNPLYGGWVAATHSAGEPLE
jgi:acid phosphatase